MIRFIDREVELEVLEKAWRSETAEFIIITGRRRIGKTRMMMEFIREKEGVFYIAEDVSKKVQIDEFKDRLSSYFEDSYLKYAHIEEWRELFSYLSRTVPTDKRFYIVIDEFSYLIKNDPSILSALQIFWDTFLSKTKVFLMISGSLLGLMEESVLSHTSPLYGRRTRDIFLTPMVFRHSKEFLNMKFRDSLTVYMSIGGIPEYLLRASKYSNSEDFFRNEFFSTTGYFYREPYYLLSQEFREIRKYFSIMTGIAYGNTTVTRIANFSGLNAREAYPYLENLIRLGFVRKILPVEGNRKHGIYVLKDAMLDTWFNMVYKNRERIERGDFFPNREDFNKYFGKRFEMFIRDEVFQLFFPSYNEIGMWWYRDVEIDIVAIDRDKSEVVFGECKWKENVDAKTILENLKEKKEKFPYKARREKYAIFAKSFRNMPEDCICIGLEDIENRSKTL